MPKFKLKVWDTITIYREHITEVESDTLEEAERHVIDMACAGAFHGQWEEEEVDTSAFDVELVKD